MQTNPHIEDGLRCFAHGDWSGAAEAWNAALHEEPGSLQARRLIESLAALKLPPPQVRTEGRPPPPAEPWGGPCVWAPVTVKSDGAGVAFLAPRTTPAPVAPLKADVPAHNLLSLQGRLHDLMVLHDFTGALAVAERILSVAPGYAPGLRARHVCRQTLQKMYESKLPPRKSVPQTLIRAEDVPWLDLDPRAGFVLSQVDGVASLDEIIDICHMELLDVLRILTKLFGDKVIGV